MPLKIKPNAIEQEEGDFIFPGVLVWDDDEPYQGDLSGRLVVIGDAVVAENTGTTSTAALTFSQEGAWVTGSGDGRYSLGARFGGEFAVYDWQQEADTLRLKGGQVAIGGSFDPSRLVHARSGPDLFARLETTGSSTASQVEFYRGGVGTYVGPTSGNEFHIYSFEDIPLVIGLNNTEIARFDPDQWFQLEGTSTLLGTGSSSSTNVRMMFDDSAYALHTQYVSQQMIGFTQGIKHVFTNDDQAIGASGTYTDIIWLGDSPSNLERTSAKYVEVDTLSGTGDTITFNRSGTYEIIAMISIETTGGSGWTMCHAYLDDNGSKLLGSDMYVTNSDIGTVQTASAVMTRLFHAGDVLKLKVSRLLGSATCELASIGGGAHVYLRQIFYL